MQTPEIKNTRQPWYKKRFVVHSKVQFILLGYAVVVGFLFLSLGLVLYSAMERILMVEVAGMGVFTYRDVILFSVVILLIIFMFFWIIVFSNRVLGPIFRLIKQMEAFGTTGKLERIQFRKSDYLVELAVSYNKLAAHFEDAELKKNTKT